MRFSLDGTYNACCYSTDHRCIRGSSCRDVGNALVFSCTNSCLVEEIASFGTYHVLTLSVPPNMEWLLRHDNHNLCGFGRGTWDPSPRRWGGLLISYSSTILKYTTKEVHHKSRSRLVVEEVVYPPPSVTRPPRYQVLRIQIP